MLKDIFGFAQNKEKGSYGLGYKLTLTRNSDNAVLNKTNATNNAEIKINSIHWYVPHYTPSLAREKILMGQIVDKKNLQSLDIWKGLFLWKKRIPKICGHSN